MGGLLGMVAEAERGPLFSTLVLVDITPRWEQAGVERILRFMRARPDGFADLDEAQQAIREYLPHRADARSPERLRKLLVPTPDGRLRWHWDPALLDSVAAEAERWGERLKRAAMALRVPVLLVSGGRSDVVSEHTIREFRELVPHAEHVALRDATHMVAGDANDRFTAVVADWLARHGHLPRDRAPAGLEPHPHAHASSATESA
jgi:pimeloyl-ACP methyl ester carboxylesterase